MLGTGHRLNRAESEMIRMAGESVHEVLQVEVRFEAHVSDIAGVEDTENHEAVGWRR